MFMKLVELLGLKIQLTLQKCLKSMWEKHLLFTETIMLKKRSWSKNRNVYKVSFAKLIVF